MSIKDSDFEKPDIVSEDLANSDWDNIFENVKEEKEVMQTSISSFDTPTRQCVQGKFMQIRGGYIATTSSNGLIIVDQHRAHERVLYDRYSKQTPHFPAQKRMFPEYIELSASDFILIQELETELKRLGFEIEIFGDKCYAIYAIPAGLDEHNPKILLTMLLEYYKKSESSISRVLVNRVNLSLAKSAAIQRSKSLNDEECAELINSLFECEESEITPDAKRIIYRLSIDEILKFFK